jgi:dihydrofolate reductase
MISLVVAMDESGIIGRDNALPWHLPADLKRFKAITLGKPILMGRKTFESIGKPLPGRLNLVLTRSRDWQREGAITMHSVEEALARAGDAVEVAVIGGEEIFKLALPFAARIYLTEVHARVEGDTAFPAFDRSQWREVERSTHPADERHAYSMTFSTLERRKPLVDQPLG